MTARFKHPRLLIPQGQNGYGLVAVLAAAVDEGFFARHASEQYLTSAQFFAQLLRQVISRPQVTQNLLGSVDLLPLKFIAC